MTTSRYTRIQGAQHHASHHGKAQQLLDAHRQGMRGDSSAPGAAPPRPEAAPSGGLRSIMEQTAAAGMHSGDIEQTPPLKPVKPATRGQGRDHHGR
jgi:hypothetical protein